MWLTVCYFKIIFTVKQLCSAITNDCLRLHLHFKSNYCRINTVFLHRILTHFLTWHYFSAQIESLSIFLLIRIISGDLSLTYSDQSINLQYDLPAYFKEKGENEMELSLHWKPTKKYLFLLFILNSMWRCIKAKCLPLRNWFRQLKEGLTY